MHFFNIKNKYTYTLWSNIVFDMKFIPFSDIFQAKPFQYNNRPFFK